jgi:hypothetical protein
MRSLVKIIAPLVVMSLLAGCAPQILKVGDLDGNGTKKDVLMQKGERRWLFLEQKDRSYVRMKKDESSDMEYFITEDGKTRYFFDGNVYRKMVKK